MSEWFRALTVYQPWAWLIVNGFAVHPLLCKDVENRGYPIKYRGRLLIHASLKISPVEYHDARWLVEESFGKDVARLLPQFAAAHSLPRGGIIGAVTLTDVRPPTANPESVWHKLAHYGWVLRDPEPLPFHRVRGQQGLWGRFRINDGEVEAA